jgi:hypothetical protein
MVELRKRVWNAEDVRYSQGEGKRKCSRLGSVGKGERREALDEAEGKLTPRFQRDAPTKRVCMKVNGPGLEDDLGEGW